MTKRSALLLAIEVVGGQAALARRIGVSQQLVSHWVTRGKKLPLDSALAIERETGISLYALGGVRKPRLATRRKRRTAIPQPHVVL